MSSVNTGNDPIQIVHGIEGLFLAGDTVRARGAGNNNTERSGIRAAAQRRLHEAANPAALDRRLGHFASAVRY